MEIFSLLNRISFGPTLLERERLQKLGFEAYIQEQLNPSEEPIELQQKLSIDKYYWKVDYENSIPPPQALSYYYMTSGEIVKLFYRDDPDKYKPRKYFARKPYYETVIVTWLKAIHSPWQLRELMVEFWHNHFHVSVDADDLIAMHFAAYDRLTIRKHVFGNFRELLEAVTSAPAMLLYLDNAYSKSSPPNENFARELMELYTLGEDHYFPQFNKNPAKVPKTSKGIATGYTDEDIFEAARAFTGWTVGMNKVIDTGISSSGEFHYQDQWHDPYQKHFLGAFFPSYQGPMEDGKKVLDILAGHEGTARFLCTKLCRWLVADEPPKSIIKKAMKTWLKNVKSPDQIAQTLQTILLSKEFEKGLKSKIKRPNHLILSFARTLGADLTPTESLQDWCSIMGFNQFNCPFPTGNPDGAKFWLNTNMMLTRWQTFPQLYSIGSKTGFFNLDLPRLIPPEIASHSELTNTLSEKLWGSKTPESIRLDLEKIFFEDFPTYSFSEFRQKHPGRFEEKILQQLNLMAMSPDFQIR